MPHPLIPKTVPDIGAATPDFHDAAEPLRDSQKSDTPWPANRDRERPRGPSPPTPPGIRITYQGDSVDCFGIAADRGFGILCPP